MKEKCDKVTSLHPKMLLGKIVSLGKQNYAKVVTQFGQIEGLIAPNNLNPCTTTNTKFDYVQVQVHVKVQKTSIRFS